MPERYGRSVCVAELRRRGEILAKIRDGWVPAGPFETPNAGGPVKKTKAVSDGKEAGEPPSAGSTSAISSESEEFTEDDISNLYITNQSLPTTGQRDMCETYTPNVFIRD